jgi:hypothetical protein
VVVITGGKSGGGGAGGALPGTGGGLGLVVPTFVEGSLGKFLSLGMAVNSKFKKQNAKL